MQLAVLISSLIFRLTLAAAPPPPASTSVCGAQRSPRGLLSSQHGLLALGKRPGWRPSPLHIYLQQQRVINVGKGENVQQLIKLLAVIFKYSLNIFWPFLDLQFCNLCCLMWKSKSLHYLKTRGFKQSFLGCNLYQWLKKSCTIYQNATLQMQKSAYTQSGHLRKVAAFDEKIYFGGWNSKLWKNINCSGY